LYVNVEFDGNEKDDMGTNRERERER